MAYFLFHILIVLFGGFIEKESRALRAGKYRIVLAKKDVAILTVSFLERLQGEPTEARPKGVLAKWLLFAQTVSMPLVSPVTKQGNSNFLCHSLYISHSQDDTL